MSLPVALKNWLTTSGLNTAGLQLLDDCVELDPALKNRLERYKQAIVEDIRIVVAECMPSCYLSIGVAKDHLRATLTLIGLDKRVPRLREAILGYMTSVGLEEGEDFPALMNELLQRNLLLEPVIEMTLAKGFATVPGRDRDVKLLVKPYTGKVTIEVDDDENVDYASLNRLENVMQDQIIAVDIPPIAGVPGRDIFGKILAPHEHKLSPVLAGSGVLYDDSKGEFIAAHNGYLLFEDRKLRIEKTFLVPGDVDLKTGHINFVEEVQIKGDVLTDFSVQSGGNMEIFGTVTGGHIVSGRDLMIHKGVMGQGKSQLRVQGRAEMKFANECHMEVDGDLIIKAECLNAKIHCLGQIQGQRAVLIGGRLVSLGEIALGTIGSELGLKTHVYLGEDYRALYQTENLRETLFAMRDKANSILNRYAEDVEYWQEAKGECSEKLPELEKVEGKLADLHGILNELKLYNHEYRLLCTKEPEGRRPVCKVNSAIFPGTIFVCRGVVLEIKELVKGPIEVRERKGSGDRVHISIVSLK